MDNEKELTHIDLFSGIGGFTLAGEWAGFETIVFCEKEKFCQKILKKHWPEIPIIEEIRDFDGTKYREATLLTGGFPCQPFSVAGQRRGKEDDRYLWPEMLRVINEAKPHWILAENVPGIFRMALDTVLADLEGEGYTTGTFIIPACGLNAPHRRNRVWIIANSRCQYEQGVKNKEKLRRSLSYKENASLPERPIKNDESRDAPDSTNDGGQELYRNMEKTKRQKSQARHQSSKESLNSNSHAQNSSSKRLEGWSDGQKGVKKKSNGLFFTRPNSDTWEKDWYEIATRFCRVDDGISDRIHRLKALGNAIVPQVAYEILKNIAWIERDE